MNWLIEWLLQKTRSYTFATAAPAMLARALQTSLQLIEQESACASSCRPVLPSCAGLQPLLQGKGWRLVPSHTAVQALVVGGNDAALGLMEAAPPWPVGAGDSSSTVPVGTARLRIALSALHTEADVNQLLAALQELAG
jgi:8-amino-7-oxononanoate synthase